MPTNEIRKILLTWNNEPLTKDRWWGAYQAVRAGMRTITLPRPAFDVCGTGGSGIKPFNVSTAAAIVLAAAGVGVAKYGSKSFSSKSGAADVLKLLGVNIDLSPAAIIECFRRTGFAFLYAPRFHPNMRYISEARQDLGVATIFNQIVFLPNPARPYRILGVAGKFQEQLSLYSDALFSEGSVGLAVTALDGMDEVSVGSATCVRQIGAAEKKSYYIYLEETGISHGIPNDVQVKDPEGSADLILKVLKGKEGTALDMILLNAALPLSVARQCTLRHALFLARETIELGTAAQKLEEIVRASRALS